ncbi:MAG: hypothetical protein WCJ85_08300 [Chitinophagaceae bacterium]
MYQINKLVVNLNEIVGGEDAKVQQFIDAILLEMTETKQILQEMSTHFEIGVFKKAIHKLKPTIQLAAHADAVECITAIMANTQVLENKEYALVAVHQLADYIDEIKAALQGYNQGARNS